MSGGRRGCCFSLRCGPFLRMSGFSSPVRDSRLVKSDNLEVNLELDLQMLPKRRHFTRNIWDGREDDYLARDW